MKTRDIHPALSSEPLFQKARAYIHRALGRKSSGDLDEYQLWASLALELLGKAALSSVHPSLVADPTHFQSLFAASGIHIATDVKTIAAHTLFERLRHLSAGFDESVKTFCNNISQRRNAELHSGEAPFRTMKLDAWEARYWHACQQILDIMDSSLDEWLGADKAKAPKDILDHAQKAVAAAVTVRIETAKITFLARKKKEQADALAEASGKSAYHYRNLFKLMSDHEWEATCPACGGKAFLAGVQVSEEISETNPDEFGGVWEMVEKSFVAEEFHCPVCDLVLNSHDEIRAAGLPEDHSETEEREMEYEPEYGNE
ncbi:MAG TPA: hypothetical protein VLC92_09615 [Rhodocyclaceae bacterium]|nr:hypothetical protein [Rhodocyclaceae bacterium]